MMSLPFVYTLSSIRGYSVVWRNADNKVVKQAIYNNAEVFTPKFKTEFDALSELPNGYIYDLHVINSNKVSKILCTKREKLPPL